MCVCASCEVNTVRIFIVCMFLRPNRNTIFTLDNLFEYNSIRSEVRLFSIPEFMEI